MGEFVIAEVDANVRNTSSTGIEKDQVTFLKVG